MKTEIENLIKVELSKLIPDTGTGVLLRKIIFGSEIDYIFVAKLIQEHFPEKSILIQRILDGNIPEKEKNTSLSDGNKEEIIKKLNYINGHCTVRDFPNVTPSIEWTGAVLDLLDLLNLNKLMY